MSLTLEASSTLGEPLLNPPGAGETLSGFREAGVVLVAIFLLTLLLVGGTYVIRRLLTGKRGRKRRPASDFQARSGANPSALPRRKRRRRSKRDNPTLAEAGGLPAKRPAETIPLHRST